MSKTSGVRPWAGALAILALMACGADETAPAAAPESGAAEARPTAPDPPTLALAPQLTCVLGAGASCVGDERFGRNPGAPAAGTVELVGGRFHACERDREGAVSCWGDGWSGQLGVARVSLGERCLGRACRSRAAATPGLGSGVVDLAAGALHTCAVTGQGRVACWGDDRLGQLGREKDGRGVAPVEGLPGRVRSVTAGELHSCAVLEMGGGVYCWGDGSEGQLGPAAVASTASPVRVPALPPVRQLAAGGEHTCALTEAGGVFCWGSNRFGELGDGTAVDRPEPGVVSGLDAGVRQIAAGDHFTCALDEAAEVACWGSAQLGQLGGTPPDDGSAQDSLRFSGSPVRVDLASEARAIGAAGDHACALTTEDEVWCWGSNEVGQLGDGTRDDRPRPVRWTGASPPSLERRAAGPTQPTQGIDVSYHSGEIDWHGARGAGRGFGFTLATAGEDFRDPLLPSHWARLREAGLHRGAYHFFVAADDPESQAEWFLSQIALEEGDLPPVVDIETLGADPPPDLPDRLRRFVEILERESGVPPIIYTGPTFWSQNLGEGFGEYPLWIAHYDVPEPTIPVGWTAWTLWQWRGDAAVEGVGAPVDLDRLAPGVRLESLAIPGRARNSPPAKGSE